MATIQDRVSRLEGAQEHVASKADLSEATGELKVEVAEATGELKVEMANSKGELKAEVANSKGELKADFAESIGELKAEMRAMELRLILRLGGLMVALAGLIIAIQRFL